MKTVCRIPRNPPRRQRGAALYVALIMLLLLALIGIVGMQVATLQERMSANYLASNMAFQRAEMFVRAGEADIMNGIAASQEENCAASFDPVAWADGIDDGQADSTRIANISKCVGDCSIGGGKDQSDLPCNKYRITAFSRDRANAAESSSLAAIDTIFIKP